MNSTEQQQIAEALKLRANDIAWHLTANKTGMPEPVSAALHREIDRLRRLAEKVCPEQEEKP
jgi:hypothetical protein